MFFHLQFKKKEEEKTGFFKDQYLIFFFAFSRQPNRSVCSQIHHNNPRERKCFGPLNHPCVDWQRIQKRMRQKLTWKTDLTFPSSFCFFPVAPLKLMAFSHLFPFCFSRETELLIWTTSKIKKGQFQFGRKGEPI